MHPLRAAECYGALFGESERLRKAERVTIWAATGLNEQLFIAHVVHRAEQWGVDATKIHLVQFETLRHRTARVLSTGELESDSKLAQ